MAGTYVSPEPLLALVDSINELAERLDVSKRTVCRWRKGGRVHLFAADRLAIRAGYHPVELWPEAFSG